MKPIALAVALSLSTLAAAPALAQATAAAPAKLSVETSPISEIVKNPEAKAILVKELPAISSYLDQIGQMTLKTLQPMSQGAVSEENLKNIQAQFDKLK